jgi:nucleotidyltransferase/DNA polymerase involved in DNA repair
LRVACVLVTHLRAKVELRNQPHLADRPAVIVDRSKGRPLVVDTFPTAVGVSAGMTLEQALSQHPGTVVLEADEPSYQREFRRMLASLQSISDRVEGAELGTAYVRLDGLEGMYGGEARLVSALLHSVPEYLHPRVGLGEGKFPSFVAARVSRTQGATRVPSDAVSFLAPHSIGLLPLASHVKDKLHRFGLHTMGDVASMRVDLLTDQFGPGGMRAWSLSRGIDDTPLIPLKYEESIVESTSLPFSSTSMELLQTAVDALLKRAYSRP